MVLLPLAECDDFFRMDPVRFADVWRFLLPYFSIYAFTKGRLT